MFKEYKTIREVVGPLMLVEGVEGVTYNELVYIVCSNGEIRHGKVLEITDKEVVMDFNHPLAGKDVRFRGTIAEVREATPEELHPAHGGCGGCSGCGSDEDGECGCNDGSCGGCH